MNSGSATPLLLWGVLFVSAADQAPPAQQPASLICPLILQQEQFYRDELELDHQLTLLDQRATERIYTLLDDLMKRDAVERLVYLRGKHDRDVSRIDHDRARIKLERQESVLEQYRIVCDAISRARTDDDSVRSAVDAALADFGRANCDVLANDEKRAEVDVAYFEEVLVSTRDLRANSVATEQDVILAELNVETARKSLEQARTRRTACREENREAPPEDQGGHQ